MVESLWCRKKRPNVKGQEHPTEMEIAVGSWTFNQKIAKNIQKYVKYLTNNGNIIQK